MFIKNDYIKDLVDNKLKVNLLDTKFMEDQINRNKFHF